MRPLRLARLRMATTAALATVLSLGLAACGDDVGDAEPGDVITAAYSNQFATGVESEVVVPTGALQVWAAQPVDQLAAGETRELRAYGAEPGTSYVPISWRYDPERFGPISAYLDTDANPSVELTTGEATYRLTPPSRHATEQSFYVMVEGAATDVALNVEFDGVVQTLDVFGGELDAGRAASLYDLDLDLEPRACGSEGWFGGRPETVQFTCEVVGPLELPYAGGRWAPEGGHWAAFGLSTVLDLYATASDNGSANWGGLAVETTLRLGNQEPESLTPRGNTDDVCPDLEELNCKYAAHALFEVDGKTPRRLHVEQAYDLIAMEGLGDIAKGDNNEATAKGSIKLR